MHEHHKENVTFQNDFFDDVNKAFKCFTSNPFQMENLTIITNTNIIFGDNIYYNISKLESTGFSPLLEFIRERLTFQGVPSIQRLQRNILFY